MKAVLISIQPKHCGNITLGIKKVEVRKTKPKIEIPFKCYIYETKDKKFENIGVHYADERKDFIHHIGKVIGEFVCDRIDNGILSKSYFIDSINIGCDQTCVPIYEVAKYLNAYGAYGAYKFYGWHISDLVIYDKPKELSEFKRVCDGNCQSCQYAVWQTNGWAYEPYIVDCKPITRPPQSWCYVEERNER